MVIILILKEFNKLIKVICLIKINQNILKQVNQQLIKKIKLFQQWKLLSLKLIIKTLTNHK